MTWVSLNTKSGNRKVGPIPVSTSEVASCPSECGLKDTDCYSRFGPLGMHWRKIGVSRGDNWNAFCDRVKKFAKGQLWRHNQAGDLPQNRRGSIHKSKLRRLLAACKGQNGWTYTHYSPLWRKVGKTRARHNAAAIKEANSSSGMVVNLSADTLTEADQLVQLGIGPVVVTLPSDAPHRGNTTPKGAPIVVCPAQTNESMTCEQCKLCAVGTRKSIVGFLAHGTAKKRLSTKLGV